MNTKILPVLMLILLFSNVASAIPLSNGAFDGEVEVINLGLYNTISSGTFGGEVWATGENQPCNISSPSPANNSVNQNTGLTWSCYIKDPEGDTFNWNISCSNGDTNSDTGASNGTKSLTISGLAHSTQYIVFVNATDSVNGTTIFKIFYFTTRAEGTTPVAYDSGAFDGEIKIEYTLWSEWSNWWEIDYYSSAFLEPTNFKVNNTNSTYMNVSWTKNTNATHTIVERSLYTSWLRGAGTEIYNDTGDSLVDSGLGCDTRYYYQAWSYNSTINAYTEDYASGNNWTTPCNPVDLHDTDTTMNTIDLAWTKATNSTNTTIVMNETGWAGFPTSRTNGTVVYDSTGSSTTISSLTENVTYWFTAWAYNPVSGFYSDGNDTDNATTIAGAVTPSNLVATRVDHDSISLTWTKGAEDDETAIRMKKDGYPTLTTGVEVYNDTAEATTINSLDPASHYYFRAWGYNGEQFSGSYTYSDNRTTPAPPSSLLGSIDGTTLTITWVKGTNATTTHLRNASATYPTDPTDGFFVSNGTGSQKIVTGVSNIDYYRAWSWAEVDGVSLFSTGVNLVWGGLEVNVYKESEPSVAIKNFTLFITNQAGTETYMNTSLNNPVRIDVADVPNGEQIAIQVSRDGYYPATIYRDLYENFWYNVTFYLVSSPEGGGDPSDGDYIPPSDPEDPDYDYNASENESYGSLYMLIVQDVYNVRIYDANVDVRKYINTTESWQTIYDVYTDANGQVEVYLTPNTLYKVQISKSGYQTSYTDYIPNPDIYTHTFVLFASNVSEEPYETLFDNVTLTLSPEALYHNESINITANLTDADCLIQWFRMKVTWESLTNASFGTVVVYNYNDTLNPCGGEHWNLTNDSSAKYTVEIWFKKQGYTEFYTKTIYYVHAEHQVPFDITELMPELFYWIVAVIITLLVTGFSAKLVGSNAVVVSLVVFGLFVALHPTGTIAGISVWWILIIMGIVTAILFMLGRAGGDVRR